MLEIHFLGIFSSMLFFDYGVLRQVRVSVARTSFHPAHSGKHTTLGSVPVQSSVNWTCSPSTPLRCVSTYLIMAMAGSIQRLCLPSSSPSMHFCTFWGPAHLTTHPPKHILQSPIHLCPAPSPFLVSGQWPLNPRLLLKLISFSVQSLALVLFLLP